MFTLGTATGLTSDLVLLPLRTGAKRGLLHNYVYIRNQIKGQTVVTMQVVELSEVYSALILLLVTQLGLIL